MECYNVTWDADTKRFHKPGGIDYSFFEEVPTLEYSRNEVNEEDQPRYLRQYKLLYPDIFDDFTLRDRYRRPATLDALAKLGCTQAPDMSSHVCETLYDYSCMQ
jgi:hypothetical protein